VPAEGEPVELAARPPPRATDDEIAELLTAGKAGWYILPDGRKVSGRANAIAALRKALEKDD
jgi:hypothetical protein